jgi:hypothetical protein
MISEEDVDKAVGFLRESVSQAAKYKSERIYLEEFRKSLKSQIMCEYQDFSLGAQERNAYADSRYIKHLEALKEAIFLDEKQRFARVAAEALIEAWRSQQANLRAIKI